MDSYINLAKATIENYLEEGKIIDIPQDLPKEMIAREAGAFVSIHLKNGDLRGCIGTFLPTRKNIAEEIIFNAISAATQDPRFPPITLDELPELVFSVDILSEPKPITKSYPLDPKTYGLIVSTADGRRGLLLPNLPGVETAEQQISICRQKAGINPAEPISCSIFTVERHEEKNS